MADRLTSRNAMPVTGNAQARLYTPTRTSRVENLATQQQITREYQAEIYGRRVEIDYLQYLVTYSVRSGERDQIAISRDATREQATMRSRSGTNWLTHHMDHDLTPGGARAQNAIQHIANGCKLVQVFVYKARSSQERK